MTVIRSYLILNLADMNDLPLMERWLLKDHGPEIISQLGPILERYVSYRAVPAPAGAEPFCPYNWRMTEHWWRELPFRHGLMDHGTSIAESWPRDYNRIVGMPEGDARMPGWTGRSGGPHPPVMVFVPYRASEDFMGKGLTLYDGTILRWITAHKYPEGVSLEEGEDWYLNVHAPEVMQQPGLKRFFSFGAVEPRMGPFVRVSELWYENANAWRKAVLDSPPAYSRPDWASSDVYPFLRPGEDFISQFLLEAPTDDFINHLKPYQTTA